MQRPVNHLGSEANLQLQGRRNILVHRVPGAIVVTLRDSYTPVEYVEPEEVFSGRALTEWRRRNPGCVVGTFHAIRTRAYDPDAEREFDPSGRRGADVLAGHDEVLAAVEDLQRRFGPDLPVQDNLPDEYWERRERLRVLT